VTYAGVLGPKAFLLSDQLDFLIQVYCDLIGYMKENDKVASSNMELKE